MCSIRTRWAACGLSLVMELRSANTGNFLALSFPLSLSLAPNCLFHRFTPMTSIFPSEAIATCQSLGHVQENPHPCNASALAYIHSKLLIRQ